MLKPVEMRGLRIVVLEEDVERVIKRLDALGNVHLTDIREFLDEFEGIIQPAPAEETLTKTAELLTRIEDLLKLLETTATTASSTTTAASAVSSASAFESVWTLEAVERRLTELEEEAKRLAAEKERLEEALSQARENLLVLKHLQEFGVDPDFVGEGAFICVFAGTVPRNATEGLKQALQERFGERHFFAASAVRSEAEEVRKEKVREEGAEAWKGKDFAVVVALLGEKEEVERILRRYEFEFWHPPSSLPASASDAISAVSEEISALKRAKAEKVQALSEMREKHMQTLTAMREFLRVEHAKARAKMLFGRSERVRVLHGWTPAAEVERVISALKEELRDLCVVEVLKPRRDDRRVPSLLKNPSIFKPFEKVIELFGHPSYKDIDPTLITAIIFPLLFGLMFPDIGHGLVLLLLGLILGIKIKSMREMGSIISFCGASSMIFGAIFGEFFGFSVHAGELVEDSLGVGFTGPLESIVHFLHEQPLFLDPLGDIEKFFIITMLIGAIHIGLGLTLNGINKLSEGEKLEGVASFVKIWCMFGALYFLLALFNFFFTFDEQQAFIFILLPILLLFILRIVSELRHGENTGAAETGAEATGSGKQEGGSANAKATAKRSAMDYMLILIDGVIDALLENFFRFLANIVSYGRILALALCHAALIEVFILLTFMCLKMGSFGILPASIVFLFGTALVIGLEAIMAGIHTVRLHFYEWFTKFYEGGGIPFKPFRLR